MPGSDTASQRSASSSRPITPPPTPQIPQTPIRSACSSSTQGGYYVPVLIESPASPKRNVPPPGAIEFPLSMLSPTKANRRDLETALALEELGMKPDVLDRYYRYTKGLVEAERAHEMLRQKIYPGK